MILSLKKEHYNSTKWLVKYLLNMPSEGKIYSVLGLFWLGLIQISYTIGSAALTLSTGQRIIKLFKKTIMSKHVIIIGWNELAPNIIKELKAQKQREFIIIANQKPEEIDLSKKDLEFYKQKQNLLDDLKQANAKQCKAIIILADSNWTQKNNLQDTDLLGF